MIQVFDNIIPLTAQQRLIDLVNERHFRWYYRKSVSYQSPSNVPAFFTNMDTSGYACPAYIKNAIEVQELMPYAQQIFDNMYDLTGIKVNDLIRVTFNLLYQHPSKEFTKDTWNSAHTDQQHDHKVLLYYVDNSDGDTFIFNERAGETFDKFTVNQRITPKRGSAVLFDGTQYHASSNPLNSFKRYTINFNFV
jgi:hypothetical protein